VKIQTDECKTLIVEMRRKGKIQTDKCKILVVEMRKKDKRPLAHTGTVAPVNKQMTTILTVLPTVRLQCLAL
jgi:hypothetical protein